MASTTAKDVVDVLIAQHETVKSLLSRVAAEATEDDFCELRRQVAIHETAEEEIVYPVLRSINDDGKRIADARTAEEKEGTEVLFKLEKLTVGTPEFTTMFEKFRTAVLTHAQNEEREVFPLLRENKKPEKLQQMAKAFELAEKAAPTHAHPHSPTSAVGNVIVGPAVAIMDHVRDAIHQK